MIQQSPATVHFLSYEPAIGPPPSVDGFDWVIYGGDLYRIEIPLPVPGEDVGRGPVDGYLDVSDLHEIAHGLGGTAIQDIACPAAAEICCEADSMGTAKAIESAWKRLLRQRGLPEC